MPKIKSNSERLLSTVEAIAEGASLNAARPKVFVFGLDTMITNLFRGLLLAYWINLR